MPYSTDDKVDNPVSLYAATKKSNELLAHAYSKLYNIPSTGLRFFTVYGPAGRPDMAYFGFTNKLVKGETIQIFNYGNCRRDFTYIDDLNFGGYITLFGNEKQWKKIGIAADRKTFIAQLEEIRQIRNDVMHFRSSGVDCEQKERQKNSWTICVL